jgi:hypothetical protein
MRVNYAYRSDTNELYVLCSQISFSTSPYAGVFSSALNDMDIAISGGRVVGTNFISAFLQMVANALWPTTVQASTGTLIVYIDIDSKYTYDITNYNQQYIINSDTVLVKIPNPPRGSHYYDVFIQTTASFIPPIYVYDYNDYSEYSDIGYTLFTNAYKFNILKTFSFINTNSTAQQILLPAISTVTDGTTIVIKDKLGTAGTGTITIYPGGDYDVNFSTTVINANNRYDYFDRIYRARDSTIDGQATYTINTNYGAVVLIKTNNNWYILSKYTGNAPRGAYAGGSVTKNTTPTVNVLNYASASTFYLPFPPNFVGGANGNPHPFVYVIMKHTSSVTFQVHAARIFGPMGRVVSSSKIDNTLDSVYAVIPSASDPACLIFFTDGTDWYIVGYQTATFTAQTYNSTAASGTLTRTNNPKSMVFVNASNTKLINLPDTIPATDKSSLYFVKLLGNIGSGVVQIQSGTTSGIAGRLQFNGRADAFRITGNYGYAWIVGSANTGATLKGYWIVASG